jgi:hypothetical protein
MSRPVDSRPSSQNKRGLRVLRSLLGASRTCMRISTGLPALYSDVITRPAPGVEPWACLSIDSSGCGTGLRPLIFSHQVGCVAAAPRSRGGTIRSVDEQQLDFLSSGSGLASGFGTAVWICHSAAQQAGHDFEKFRADPRTDSDQQGGSAHAGDSLHERRDRSAEGLLR